MRRYRANTLLRVAIACMLAAPAARAQNLAVPPQSATSAPQTPSTHAGPQEAGPGATLYRRLATAGLDLKAVYSIRGAPLDREDLHITLEDGVIGFLQAVDGHVTGAFFQGSGEVLIIPPDLAERGSLALFTGSAILEDKFQSAYFRFNDDTMAELMPYMLPEQTPPSYVDEWNREAKELGEADALRLMASFVNQPPAGGDRMLRARLQSSTLGIFDVYYDTLAPEQIAVYRFANGPGDSAYYDVLTSFVSRSARRSERSGEGERSLVNSLSTLNRLRITKYTVRTEIDTSHKLSAEAALDIEVRGGGDRLLFFELSRWLKVEKVTVNGLPVEFLQNVALEGSALARRGNDIVAVLAPRTLQSGERVQLDFTYSGDVLSDAGNGLLYVGARGIWYPNRGMMMADYDLKFTYPQEWTLVATGKRESESSAGGKTTSRWVSERKLPVAGFNLGEYQTAAEISGDVKVEAYAARTIEPGLIPPQKPAPESTKPNVPPPPPPPTPDPAVVAQQAARAIEFYTREFGPYPYSSLALTQLPGVIGQAWPGLIFLSSLAFLPPAALHRVAMKPGEELLYGEFMTPHETAHQWWGDLVGWKSYRDQWLVEALANYSALLELEHDHPEDCRAFLGYYRDRLLEKNANGEETTSAGAVTLGQRLNSSHFPSGFFVISYGRGMWLIHMLRTMMADGAKLDRTDPPAADRPRKSGMATASPAALKRGPKNKVTETEEPAADEEPFLRVLRNLDQHYQEKEISTREFQALVEGEMPRSIRYEGRSSLDWFFDGWVNGTAIPKLDLKDVRIRGARATATLLQTEAPDELVTSVPIYAETRDGLKLVARVFADGSKSNITVTVPLGTKKLVLDPYETVLRRP